jgi:hypothetical protein
MIDNMIKTQLFLHEVSHYIQIYNFTLNRDYKFKTVIMFENVWILNFKRVYIFLVFEYFEHMDPFLWVYQSSKKKFEMILWTFERKKDFWSGKPTYPHVFFECFKHIKGLLKHCEFSWKFCSCNFESLRPCFKN